MTPSSAESSPVKSLGFYPPPAPPKLALEQAVCQYFGLQQAAGGCHLRCAGEAVNKTACHQATRAHVPLTVVRRRALGVTWQSRKVALTKDRLWIGKFDGNVVLDFIPLREISKVKTKEKRAPRPKSSLLQSLSTRSGKRPPMQSSGHHEHAPADPGPESPRSAENHFLHLDDDDHKHRPRVRRRQSISHAPPSYDAYGSDSDHEDDDPALIFAIQTIDAGSNSGKTTVLQTKNREECEKWVQAIEGAHATLLQKLEKERLDAQTLWRRVRDRAGVYYNSNPFQYAVGIIIMASYVAAMFEAQV